jgi:hypothetical protein
MTYYGITDYTKNIRNRKHYFTWDLHLNVIFHNFIVSGTDPFTIQGTSRNRNSGIRISVQIWFFTIISYFVVVFLDTDDNQIDALVFRCQLEMGISVSVIVYFV